MIRPVLFAAGLLVLIYRTLLAEPGGALPNPNAGLPLIPMVTSDEILAKIDAGAKVVFIDAREAAEFEEDHIPGAINIPLREVTSRTLERFRDADLVVTYCLKDFRGYELGRALQETGLKSVRLMKDYGINAWKRQGLPVASRGGLSDAEALAQLRLCAEHPGQCTGKGAS